MWRATRRCCVGVLRASTRCCQYASHSGGGDAFDQVSDVRQRLSQQQEMRTPRSVTLGTEGRLVMLLACSARPGERDEALERGADMWRELCNNARQPIVSAASAFAMQMSLCRALQRCALLSGRREVAKEWAERAATAQSTALAHVSFDYDDGNKDTAVASTSDNDKHHADDGDGDEDNEHDVMAAMLQRHNNKAGQDTHGAGGGARRQQQQQQPKRAPETPMDRFRNDIMRDHPIMQLLTRRAPEPGPRYTG